jgi:hypothetical protein
MLVQQQLLVAIVLCASSNRDYRDSGGARALSDTEDKCVLCLPHGLKASQRMCGTVDENPQSQT